jgi:hypothetical protein
MSTHTMYIPQNMISLYKSVHRVSHCVVLHSVTSHPGMWCLSASNQLLPVGFPIKKIINDNDNNNRSNMLIYCSILDIINTLNVKEFGYWHKKLFLQLSNNLTVITRLSLFCVLPHIFILAPITCSCYSHHWK